jgi:putative ABC transport system ATP-binding protein/lipoprotein-releasing system ATP-binding protein
VLIARGVSFSYRRGGEMVIDRFSREFRPGAITGLTGPSGCGKSTLLYLLGLLLRPAGGAILVGGREAGRLSDGLRSELRATHIGFVFQDAALDASRTILDSVMEPALYAGQTVPQVRPRAEALLDQFGLAHRARHRPGQISGGQAQRVALCRALVTQAGVILADEPTGNLDEGNTAMVLDALADLAAGGRTVVVATHDPLVAARCDEVVDLGARP